MLTTVALTWNEDMRCTLVAGDKRVLPDGDSHPVALLAPNVVVAFTVEAGRSVELVVFRTSPPVGSWPEIILGVDQPVQVLLRIRGRRRIIRVERAIRFLNRCCIDLERPSDMFWSYLSSFAYRRWSPLRISLVIDLLERPFGSVSSQAS
jgi:hypothetical protein